MYQRLRNQSLEVPEILKKVLIQQIFLLLIMTMMNSVNGVSDEGQVKKSLGTKSFCVVRCLDRHVGLTFGHRSFTFNSNKSPTWCKNFSVYYPDICLQLNMFWAFSRPSSGAQWLQWQLLVLPWYRGDSRVVFVVGPAGRPDHEHSTDSVQHV